MISAGDFRKGQTFEMDGDVYQVIDFQHVKPGKGAAFVRTKIRDIMHGGTKEVSFNPSDRYPKAHIETKEMQYLYTDGELYHFMDTETYEQMPLEHQQVEDAIRYIRENDNVVIRFYKGKAFDVQAPNFVELEVTHTEPGIKGDTATGATKPATVETGAIIQVPLFVNIGDVIKIDTRTDDYLSRV
ncbi:elongation factor P [Gottschalkia acidurici 9a]|uniref:Elongation factor P n=1 Tax=Gottschalkia acidurici (strain ATCC 7906 / DSM 604 / BCRC 14475 / CIP 104303 / KCTC 5404 / NCIMB 10678 / 9a) TaxID=1128398 RepID=K0B0E4_GOTA9|nr:elongation factor P [Gottschalkia acidurici]AFS78380.1 elongation factor P [Gottschalkia acidurici 9a]